MQSTKTGEKNVRPRLAVTLGDPAGIGAEVILKALADPQIRDCDLTLVGSTGALVATYNQLRHNQHSLASDYIHPDQLSILDVKLTANGGQISTGTGNAASGAASFAYLETAIARTLAGEFDGIVTAPIAKSAWKAAGYNYPGQTELLAEKAGVKRFGMLFVARSPYTGWTLRTLLATTHIPLCQVADTLTPELLSAKLDLLVECLQQDFGVAKPRIAIAGLNPHSGEQGQLGREEIDWLIPWLEKERQNRPLLQLEGPIPPDTMWVKPGQAWYGELSVLGGKGAGEHFSRGETSIRLEKFGEEKLLAGVSPQQTSGIQTDFAANFSQNLKSKIQNPPDAYLALYHDQGLIPVKLMAFDRAVNTSIGLPFIRTSPDHGTAFDIAGKGIADATSMKAAIQLATELAFQRIAAKSV
jgi:4-hydroxythreonine-4-phosphate dehydrogenase